MGKSAIFALTCRKIARFFSLRKCYYIIVLERKKMDEFGKKLFARIVIKACFKHFVFVFLKKILLVTCRNEKNLSSIVLPNGDTFGF